MENINELLTEADCGLYCFLFVWHFLRCFCEQSKECGNRITSLLCSPVMFYDVLGTGMKTKNLKASVAPKPWYSRM